MALPPPANSKIAIAPDANGFLRLSLPFATSFMRYFAAAFLIFWLCGWAVGWISVATTLITGHSFGHSTIHSAAPKAFLLFWFCGWTVGGGFAIAMLYRMLRPAVPETLTLSHPNLVHDTGVQPVELNFGGYRNYRDGVNPWKRVFRKRQIRTYSPIEIATLKLRDIDSSNRLTIDSGNDRIELGSGLTEVEREWLFNELKSEYQL